MKWKSISLLMSILLPVFMPIVNLYFKREKG
jgi:hypothetical protein